MSTRIYQEPNLTAATSLVGPHFLSFEEDGEVILRADVKFGFVRRQIEKCMESVPYTKAVAFAEKADFLAAPIYAFGFASAVERIGNVQVPERGEYIRVILSELARIQSHIFFLGNIAREVGLSPIFHFCLREREKYCDLFELYCGSRLGFGAIILGGVAEDATEGFLFRVENVFRETNDYLAEIRDVFTHNPVLTDRLAGLAPLRKESAFRYGISGPNARSSGLPSDVRISHPYSAYHKLSFSPAQLSAYSGDALARFRYRLEEIEVSMQIVRAAISKMPGGNFSVEVSEGFAPAQADIVTTTEGPRGQISVLLLSSGQNKPARVKLAPPSLCSLRFLPELLRGVHVDDAYLVMNSLDISFSEVDR